MRETQVIGTLLIFVLLVLGGCAPIPGHVYTDGIEERGGDGEPIVLVNNPDATDPTYAGFVAFITNDTTDTKPYIDGGPEGYVCADFAEEVHNNAEAVGIRAAWVAVDFEDEEEGHALNAFNTTDKGLVYIDCTGGKIDKVWDAERSCYLYIPKPMLQPIRGFAEESKEPENWDTIAYIEIGKEYGLIGINGVKSLQYNFYSEYTQSWQEYEYILQDYNKEVQLFNQRVVEYNTAPVPPFAIISDEEIHKYNVKMEREFNELKAWKAKLDKQEQILDNLEEKLGYYYELTDTSGIVKYVYIHW